MKNNRLDHVIRKTVFYFVMSILTLIISGNLVLAQSEKSSDKNKPSDEEFSLEEITVTGSRLRTTGMETPTPVTVISIDQIEVLSPTTLIEGLAELPQFYGSNTTQTPGSFFTSSGAGNLNLRGLNDKRTLQLLDGRRVVPSSIFGGPDMNLFPENLLRTVETVTGGASAAYGTDAVAGVVNFILNTEYEGVKGKIQYGVTEKGDNKNNEFSIAGGFAITDRAHLLISAESSKQDPIWGYDLLDYGWYDAWSLIENPDTVNRGTTRDNPYFIPAQRVYSMNASLDGILRFSNNSRYIFDANGVATPFVMGNPCNTSGCSTVNGGSGTDNIFPNTASQITPESSRDNVFGYIDYDVSHKLNVYGQVMYGKAEFTSKNFGGLFPYSSRSFTIYRDNPYLPADIRQLMITNNWTSAGFGRIGGFDDLNVDAYTTQKTETLSLTTGMEYNVSSGFFDGWQVKSYYQYGETDMNAIQRGGIRLDRIYLAADVVTDPLTGQPACNVTVTTRGTANPIYQDCVPLNLFGRGNASPQAIDWVTGFESGVRMNAEGFISDTESMPYSYISGVNKQRVVNIDQHVFEVSADGEIYKGWGAGPLRMGLGYGYREESFTQVVEAGPGGNINADPTYRPVRANNAALGIRGVPGGAAASGNSVEIQFSNVPFARGDQNVHEGFTELLVPIIADFPFIKKLNYQGAVRWAKYSGAGNVYSWKNGLDWSVLSDLRFRGTISQDARAATMGEKFDRTGGIGTVTDYLVDPAGGSGTNSLGQTYTSSYTITTFSNGSPDIKPEEARTKTVGVVYTPRWLQGLNFSLDWYTITVKDNINQIGAGAVVSGCYLDNDQDLCNQITRSGSEVPTASGGTINQISLVGVPYYNQASVKGTGVDFEIDYQTIVTWFGGGETAGLRLLGSYLGERSNTSSPSLNRTTGILTPGVKTEVQGAIGFPEWTVLLSGNYMRGPFGISMNARYVDKMLINRTWNNGTSGTNNPLWDVLDNTVDSEILVDARVNYRFNLFDRNLNVSLNVNNLFNKEPQQYLTGAFSSAFGNDTGLGVTGDLRGRRYVLGVNFEF